MTTGDQCPTLRACGDCPFIKITGTKSKMVGKAMAFVHEYDCTLPPDLYRDPQTEPLGLSFTFKKMKRMGYEFREGDVVKIDIVESLEKVGGNSSEIINILGELDGQ